ncbi:MAG TPA: sigma-70 family RNA polymerase sigma factor [Ignavibacteriaceae bacterium]|nr:sigma-70 family RNA polymerase sigma factor [Ignavibacteriaceae bacterium]
MPVTPDYEEYDAFLVKAIKEGEHEAYKNLYYKYFKPLVRYAWYRTNSMETARDLVQDIFFKIWINRELLNPAKSIKAYLYRALLNSIINFKKLSSSKTVSFDQIRNLTKENSFEADIDIYNTINKLPGKLKEVYILSSLEGYKYSEIAEICGISEKAVEKRMSKAFNILRKFLCKY